MSPHLSAKLLKPASPRLHPDSAVQSDSDDDMVYSPYYRTAPHRSGSTSKPRRRSHQLSPELRAEIVARVLDPAYSGRRERDLYSARVFVDPNGDEHDPDYQLFPTYTQPTYSRHRRSQTTNGFFRRMPSEEELSREEEDAESEAEWTRVRAASPYSSGSTSSTPSPPANPLSLFDDDEWDEKEWTREVVVPVPQSKRRKHAKVETPRTVYIPVPVEPSTTTIEEPEPEPEYEAPARRSSVQLVREDTMDTTTDETPSCGYVLRRQWATFALHTRLSAHRIARRARRAVSVGT